MNHENSPKWLESMHKRRSDLTGQKFGRLAVLSAVPGASPTRWLVECDCGVKKTVRAANLKSGGTVSCGYWCKAKSAERHTVASAWTNRMANRYTAAEDSGCWVWLGGVDGSGYGQVRSCGKSQRAHRLSYEFHRGAIPDGLVLDHLCRNPRCINPEHLEPVTQEENLRRFNSQRTRITHCKRGHAFADGDYRWYKGNRHCRKCWRHWYRERQLKKLAPQPVTDG